eukprot:1747947-Amphidinium_carterae.2
MQCIAASTQHDEVPRWSVAMHMEALRQTPHPFSIPYTALHILRTMSNLKFPGLVVVGGSHGFPLPVEERLNKAALQTL